MTPLILRVAVGYLVPLLMGFSLFLLLRGHHAPGGGFAAGLIAASAVAFHTMAFSAEATRRVLRVPPTMLVGAGLLLMALAAVWGLAVSEPLLSAQWTALAVPLLGPVAIGTPLVFDSGVYLTVTGSVLVIIMALDEA